MSILQKLNLIFQKLKQILKTLFPFIPTVISAEINKHQEKENDKQKDATEAIKDYITATANYLDNPSDDANQQAYNLYYHLLLANDNVSNTIAIEITNLHKIMSILQAGNIRKARELFEELCIKIRNENNTSKKGKITKEYNGVDFHGKISK